MKELTEEQIFGRPTMVAALLNKKNRRMGGKSALQANEANKVQENQ